LVADLLSGDEGTLIGDRSEGLVAVGVSEILFADPKVADGLRKSGVRLMDRSKRATPAATALTSRVNFSTRGSTSSSSSLEYSPDERLYEDAELEESLWCCESGISFLGRLTEVVAETVVAETVVAETVGSVGTPALIAGTVDGTETLATIWAVDTVADGTGGVSIGGGCFLGSAIFL
jgi:hypothetical protein